MKPEPKPHADEPEPENVWYRRPEFFFATTLFTVAVIVLTMATIRSDGVLAGHHPSIAVFFFLYGLFTINVGYDQPGVGYVSFDRVSQVASILILGPLGAAWVNGLASLAFPWRRLRSGTAIGNVITASLNNSGLMSLLIFGCGSLYTRLGGAVPLTTLDARSIVLLPLLIVSMQVVNEALMGIYLTLRGGRGAWSMQSFAVALECGSGVTGVLVALVWTRMEAGTVGLLLIVLSAGMLALKQFARMRLHLESLVDERTRVLQEKTVELDRLATRDQLTGLFNRRYADSFLIARIDEFHRYGRGFSIALVDLDHFKRINDERSHEVGDRVLKRVARIFTDRCRDTDVVARYGGEEFLLCFPEAGAVSVAAICEQLRLAIESADWTDIDEGLSVSISAGIAEMQYGFDRGKLLSAADRKLYAAKDAGRNLVFS